MTTPTQRIIATTEASLDALDASLLDLQHAAATKFGDVCAWCGGPCVCPDFDAEWPGELDDLHQALADAAAACPDCSPRCASCGDAAPDGVCDACAESEPALGGLRYLWRHGLMAEGEYRAALAGVPPYGRLLQ